jgi:hypothetical protein
MCTKCNDGLELSCQMQIPVKFTPSTGWSIRNMRQAGLTPRSCATLAHTAWGICSKASGVPKACYNNIVTYSGVLFTMELYCAPKGQYTTVKHSQQLFEHTYTSDLTSTGTLIPIESSNTHSHSCSQKASKHTSGQFIVGLSVHLHTTTAPQWIVHH